MKFVILGLSLAVLALAACAETKPTPVPIVAPPPPPPPRPVDSCGAAEAQSLVGQSRTEIPIPVLPSLQRVACTRCAITADYNPRRLNFFYDSETGIVREVKCG